jgi:hypothetical protein
MPSPSLPQRLKERKLVQWALAYLAGGFVVLQILDAVAEPLSLSMLVQRVILVLLGIGFLLTLEEAVREGRRAVAIMPRERHAQSGPEFLFNLAALHAHFGELDGALEVLEELLSAPSRYAPNMLEDHFRLRPIHDDPRFKALMDRERNTVF